MKKIKNKYFFRHSKLFFFLKHAVILITGVTAYSQCCCQCPDEKIIYTSITKTEKSVSISDVQKLKIFYASKKNSDDCKLPHDSVYATILENIGEYEFRARNYDSALLYYENALRINNSLGKNSSRILAVRNYSNLAHYYDQLLLLKKALAYYDTTIAAATNFSFAFNYILDARLYKSYIFFRNGDFQKGAEESTIGINLSLIYKDTLSFLRFLNQRAQSFFFENKLQQADNDLDSAISLSQILHQPFQLASAYKIKSLLNARNQDFTSAEVSFAKSIRERISANRPDVVASDYNDFGNFYRDSLHLYGKAENCYYKAIMYAEKNTDSARLGMISVNLEKTFFKENNYPKAELYFLKEMKFLKLYDGDNFFFNPSARAINLQGNKQIIIAIFQDKTELLLKEYNENGNKKYLTAALQTALLADSVITQIRYEQIGEQSKLYWRNNTRKFYTNALEVCYLNNNTRLAFFFMEKSRAVLLNDKLNEMGAAAHLPPDEETNEERLQINITEQQQKFSLLNDTSKDYAAQQYKLLQAKENFENYIKSLEEKYPVYYQYKYADDVPSLNELQKYLAANNQSFVHYFINDTVSYILSVTSTGTKFIRLSKKDFNTEQPVRFLQFCSDKEFLNNHYNLFAALSDSLYTTLFQPLQLPKGRVIICADNYLIPFEALCTDAPGKNFLINDYAFSYVYSARFLMKQFNSYSAKGDFLGIAPVSFATNLDVPDLKLSAVSLNGSANYYHSAKLLTNSDADKNNFLKYLPKYIVVNIFSHAHADSSENEPLLYMCDSVIHLSELQLINDPATKLIVLSACQTSVGKNATGEGIYSLARGFAAAGIPSVAATLWKADEQTIYAVSESFNHNLSLGMTKDVALQRAELSFMQNNDVEKSLPFFWANMIIVGNTDPVLLSADHHQWWMIAGDFVLIIVFVIIWKHRKKKKFDSSTI